MTEIDWEELGEIEDGNFGWRAALSTKGELSSVYVAGEGDNPEAFIIGEAPGAQEEAKRRPFVGTAGVAMRDLMALAGLFAAPQPVSGRQPDGVVRAKRTQQANCWLTNVVKFRPTVAGRRNRKPLPVEIEAARPWLRREWAAVGKPRLIIPTGGVALTALFGKPQSILAVAGRCHLLRSREGFELYVWPMVHPSFGVRTPAARPLLETDWENLGRWRREHA